jgi:hypothetical protein
MTLDESARRLGSIVWFERRLFEVMGRWVPSTPERSVKLMLARQSRHHAEHAAAVEVVLPETRDHDPATLITAGDPAAAARVEAVAGRVGTEERLRSLVDELIPHRLAACEAFLAEAAPVRDGPGIRALIFVLAEERAELTDLANLRGTLPDLDA